MSKKTHPISEGWLHLDITLTSGQPLSEAEAKNILAFGAVKDVEFGPWSQNGKKLKGCTRRLKSKA